MRLPVAFQRLVAAAADQVLAARSLHGGWRGSHVLLVLLGVAEFHLDDQVGDGHGGLHNAQQPKSFSISGCALITRSSASSCSSSAFICFSGTALGPSLMALAGPGAFP